MELEDAKANLESHQNKSQMEKESLQEIGELIKKSHAQFDEIRKELNVLRGTIEASLKEKALGSREQVDKMGDMIAKLRLEMSQMQDYKKKLEAQKDLSTAESDMLQQISGKIADMDEHIKELEMHAKTIQLQLQKAESGHFD